MQGSSQREMPRQDALSSTWPSPGIEAASEGTLLLWMLMSQSDEAPIGMSLGSAGVRELHYDVTSARVLASMALFKVEAG